MSVAGTSGSRAEGPREPLALEDDRDRAAQGLAGARPGHGEHADRVPPTNRSEFGRTDLAPAFAVHVTTRPLMIAAPVSLRVAAIRTVNVPPAFGEAGAVFRDLKTTRGGATFTSYA